MSEELEWELYELFEAGLFPFPIYDHGSARRIISYLLMRNIMEEEIADAIEDSTIDLQIWLAHNGRNMVGEWVIAWMNDCWTDYKKERDIQQRIEEDDRLSLAWGYMAESQSSRYGGDGDDDDDDNDDDGHGDEERRSNSRITDLESISSQAATSVSADVRLDDQDNEPADNNNDVSAAEELRPSPSPPPLPPRTLMFDKDEVKIQNGILKQKALRPQNLDLTTHHESIRNSSTERLYQEAPDSGHVSDLYTCIPPDKMLDALDMDLTLRSSSHHDPTKCLQTSCSQCNCTISHYSYIHSKESRTEGGGSTPDNHNYCHIYDFDDESVDNRALDLNIETLDREGPGFIFIMTDSYRQQHCLPWSDEHRYKITSSRQPERCLMEFRTRNIEIELIWQVRVQQHLKAAREVQTSLQKYNVHSNWFKCSLSLIMDAMSLVAKRYK